MTGIRKDLLGGLPQQLQEANDQLKTFIGTFQSFMGMLGQTTGAIGQAVGKVQDQVSGPQAPPVYLTPQGQSAHGQFMEALSNKMATEAYSRSIARRAEGEMLPSLGGQTLSFSKPIVEIGGQKIHTVLSDNSNNQAIDRLKGQIRVGLELAGTQEQTRLGARMGFGLPKEQTPQFIPPSQFTPPNRTPQAEQLRSSFLGYTMADVPRVGNLDHSAVSGNLGKSIESLKLADDANSKAMVRVLEDIKKELGNQAREFGKARDAFVMAGDTQDEQLKIESQNKLLEAVAKLDQSIDKANTAYKGTGGGGPPPGPTGMPFGRMLGIGAAAVGAGVAGYQFYNQSAMAQDKVIMDAQLNKTQAQAKLSTFAFRETMESQDMTKAENIMRYRGNYFTPNSMHGKFFGDKGALGNSFRAAGERGEIGTDIEHRERTGQLIGGMGSIASAAMMGIGGALMMTGAGTPLGAAMFGAGLGSSGILGGAQSTLGQATGMFGSYVQNPYTTYNGDLNSGIGGMFGAFRRGPQFDRLGGAAVQAARLNKVGEAREYARSLQDAEMDSDPRFIAEKHAIDQRLSLVKARQEGAVMVGEYAATGQGYLNQGSAPRIVAALDRESTFRKTEARHAVGVQMRANLDSGQGLLGDAKTQYYNQVNDEIAATKAKIDKDYGDTPLVASVFKTFYGAGAGLSALAAGVTTDFASPQASKPAQKRLKETFREFNSGFAATDVNPQRLINAIRTVETGKASGDYNAVNQYGMVGAYQIDPNTWNKQAQEKYGMRVQDMVGNKAIQDKMYNEVIAPEFKKTAIALQKRNPLAAMLPTELVAGLNQLGPGNIESFFNTGKMVTGNGINDPMSYLKQLSKHTGQAIPQNFFEAFETRTGASAGPDGVGPAKPLSLAASLEMSMPEFIQSQNQLTNYLGSRRSSSARAATGLTYTGIQAGEGQTAEMIRLGRSGLGSFDQLVGNLGTINQIQGGQDNTKTLEATLSQAVAAGFDKSRTSQKFMQTTASIAESLRLSNMASTAAMLGTTAGLVSATGTPDEKSMHLAAQGLQAYGNFTGQTSGMSGALTAIGASNAGFTSKNGAGIVSKLSAPQLMDYIKTLQSGGEINDMGLSSLVALNGGDKKGVEAMLRATRNTTIAPFTAALDQRLMGQTFGGIKYEGRGAFFDKISKLPREGRQSALKQLMPQVWERFAQTPVGSEGGGAFIAEELEARHMGADKNLTEFKKNSGNAVYRDQANQNRLNFIEDLTKDFSATSKGSVVGVDKMKDLYFRSLKDNMGAAETINYNGKEVALTRESYDKGDAGFKKAANDRFAKMDAFEISRGLQDKVLQESNAQPVKIMNLESMIELMYRFGKQDGHGNRILPSKE